MGGEGKSEVSRCWDNTSSVRVKSVRKLSISDAKMQRCLCASTACFLTAFSSACRVFKYPWSWT